MAETDVGTIRQALSSRAAPGGAGLWPQNVEIATAFVSVANQWRTAPAPNPAGGVRMIWLGLDYSAVRAGLELCGIDATPLLWRGVRLMEQAAANKLNGEPDQ